VLPRAETGARLDDRYRLDDLLHTSSPVATLWRATDEVLGRPVAARIVTDQSREQSDAVLAAAARAGVVPDARWVRVLDVGTGSAEGGRHSVWVISEWVEGPALATVIREHPLRGPVATAIVLSCAQAVEAAQQHGATHGVLHPDEIVLPADGNPRITGLELSLALRAETHPALRAESDSALRAESDAVLRPQPHYDDQRGLGGLLYAALTGRWPLPGWDGLPHATRGDLIHPRHHRHRIDRTLDEIAARALSGGYPDAATMAADLAGLPLAPLHPPPPEPEDPRGKLWSRVAWRVVPPLMVAGVGLGAWTLGSELGRVPSPARAVAPSFPQPRQSAGKVTTRVVWSTPPHIVSFDPEGDGAEDPGGVGLAVDDDPSTMWNTDTYVGKPQFGGLKQGVGLLLDLGRPTTVDDAQLLLSAPGADLQIRAGSVRPTQASDLPVVASRNDSPEAVRLALTNPVRARYWLLWITSLPKVDGGYRLGVAEIALLH
jgi:serine/threonine protein kinase